MEKKMENEMETGITRYFTDATSSVISILHEAHGGACIATLRQKPEYYQHHGPTFLVK